MTQPEDQLLRAIVVRHLNGAPAPAAEVSGRIDGERLVDLAEAERLLGPLVDAVVDGELDGSVELAPATVERLHERHAAAMLWCLQLETRLLEVADLFDAAGGVDFLVLKGVAVAHLDETDPALRSFADVDLLVTGSHVDRAVGVLETAGATRPWPQRRPGYDRRFAKSVTLTFADGVEVDLHRSIVDGVHGARVPLEEMFRRCEHFDLGGRTFQAPSKLHRFLHAGHHAMLGSTSPRLLSLRDLAGYMTAPDLEVGAVTAEAQHWGGTEVLAGAVTATLAQLPVDAPGWVEWLDRVELDPAELRRIERHRDERSSFGPAKLDLLRELDSVGDRAAYLYAALWPTSEHLAARGRRRSDNFRELLRRVRR